MNYILLLFGFFLLIKGADYFVDGSSSIAKYLKIPPIIIGLTIVAFGTSAPEAAVSISASIDNQNGMAIGNAIGSNIFNLLMVVGATGFVKTLYIEKSILSREFPFLLFTSILLVILCNNGLSSFDGLILLIFFIGFIYYIIKITLNSKDLSLEESSLSLDTNIIISVGEKTILKSVLYSVCGIIAIVIGGKLVVSCASYIASSFGISDQLIGLTIVSIGTSLPEFVTCVIASTKGEGDLALGNVVGSNIFNILFVLGISSFISPIDVNISLIIDALFMIFATIVTYLFAIKKKDINKYESLILIGIYLAYMCYLITTS